MAPINDKPYANLSDNPNRFDVMTWMLSAYSTDDTTILGMCDLPDGLTPRDARKWATAMLKQRGYRVIRWRNGFTDLEPIELTENAGRPVRDTR